MVDDPTAEQRFACPVSKCPWFILAGELTLNQINSECFGHMDEHPKEDYIDTIMEQQQAGRLLAKRVEELESALRGAALMQGVQAPPGLLVPDGAGVVQAVTERKRGDKVEIAGQERELVGKRITDPAILKKLRIKPKKRGPQGG